MAQQVEVSRRGAAVIPIPPPAYYAAGLGLGMLINSLVLLPIGGRPTTIVVALATLVGGLGLAGAGVAAVVRNRTTIVPHHPVAALVQGGPYRLSRNPMYTGLGIAYLGAALLLNSWWPIFLWPAVMLTVDRLVIRPEERYLTEHFGRPFLEYRTRVRRWL